MKKLIPTAIFAITFGLVEAAVVVYLREIYYPYGFSFPLNPYITQKLLLIEWAREASTIVMLLCVGIIAGSNFTTKFCYFLFSFGVWDIFYYIWLKIFLNWPESLFTWDLLYLIPVPWVGPVLAPILCSLTMIFISTFIIYYYEKNGVLLRGGFFEWFLAILGAFIVYVTFVWDFTKLIIKGGFLKKFFKLAVDPEFATVVASYVPQKFLWLPFILGLSLVLISFFKVYHERKTK